MAGTLSNCCIELHLFAERIANGNANKAPDVSDREPVRIFV